jgi:hypothetical protein
VFVDALVPTGECSCDGGPRRSGGCASKATWTGRRYAARAVKKIVSEMRADGRGLLWRNSRMPLVARQIRCRICPHHFPNITDPATAGSFFVRCVGAYLAYLMSETARTALRNRQYSGDP